MPDPWITPDDVAEYLGTVAADDPRVVRSDLTFTDATTAPEDVRLGATMWASVMVQQRSAPGGYDGYDAETALADAGAKRAEIYRLLGFRRPVVA